MPKRKNTEDGSESCERCFEELSIERPATVMMQVAHRNDGSTLATYCDDCASQIIDDTTIKRDAGQVVLQLRPVGRETGWSVTITDRFEWRL